MIPPDRLLVPAFARLSPRLTLPFRDAASAELPLGRMLRAGVSKVSGGALALGLHSMARSTG